MIHKTLSALVLAAALTACKSKFYDNRYDFKGQIGTESIEFKREKKNLIFGTLDDIVTLRVNKQSSREIIYKDFMNDGRVDEVVINGVSYINDTVGKAALEVAQKQFDGYLTKILHYKLGKAANEVSKFND